MSDRNLQLKYDILKARIANLIEEHADALALAQMFKSELSETKKELDMSRDKLSVLEGKLKRNDIQEKEPRVTIIDSVETSDN
jgi:hypothetical protein